MSLMAPLVVEQLPSRSPPAVWKARHLPYDSHPRYYLWSVTVDIGTLPNLPTEGIPVTPLVKSDDLSLVFP